MVYVIQVCWQLASRIRTERIRQVGPQRQSGLFEEILVPARIWTPDREARSLLTIPTRLYQLLLRESIHFTCLGQDGTSWSCLQAVSKPVWHITLLCVQWKTPGDGQRNCPKHVDFYSKNKFEKLVHLVGFITYSIAVRTVKNSWWWTEELSETCRVLFQK